MKDDGKKYVVYGMKAKCSEGSMENYISTDVGHGVLYQGQPLLNANDHTPQVNLTHFGDCHSKKIYEEAKKQADEKYKADADDGFFEKAGKLLAKTVTKAAISMKENFCANKCELDTPLPWMFVNKEHMIDGAPALTVESQCACRYGGIITIVPEPEEEVTIETEEVALAENMAEPDEVEVKELEKEKVAWMKAGQIPMTSEAMEKAFLEEFLRKTQGSFYPRTKYMREWAQKRLEEIEEEQEVLLEELSEKYIEWLKTAEGFTGYPFCDMADNTTARENKTVTLGYGFTFNGKGDGWDVLNRVLKWSDEEIQYIIESIYGEGKSFEGNEKYTITPEQAHDILMTITEEKYIHNLNVAIQAFNEQNGYVTKYTQRELEAMFDYSYNSGLTPPDGHLYSPRINDSDQIIYYYLRKDIEGAVKAVKKFGSGNRRRINQMHLYFFGYEFLDKSGPELDIYREKLGFNKY